MPPKSKMASRSFLAARYMPEPEPRERVDDDGDRGGRNSAMAATSAARESAAEPPVVLGLAELVELLNTMGAAPPGARPKLNQDTITRIDNSPLSPVLRSLQPIYKKLGPVEGSPEHLAAQAQAALRPEASQPASTPGSGPPSAQPPTPAAAPAAAGITNAEAGLRSVSSKLNSVSQAVTDMKQSAKAAKEQMEAVDQKVSQISGRLDPALADLMEEVKRLQVDLVEEFSAERTRFETKIKGLETEVRELGEEVKELKKETRDLQQVIRDTKAELLPVEAASEIALQGTFSDELGKKGGHGGNGKANPDLLQTAKKVRTNTLGLITRCRALFAVINPNLETDANVPNVSMEGEWGRCAEHLRTSNSRLQDAVEEKEETVQKLHLVGLVIDQMRKGHSARVLTQDLSRLTATQPIAAFAGPASSAASAKPNPSTARTGVTPSQADGSSPDLNTSDCLPFGSPTAPTGYIPAKPKDPNVGYMPNSHTNMDILNMGGFVSFNSL